MGWCGVSPTFWQRSISRGEICLQLIFKLGLIRLRVFCLTNKHLFVFRISDSGFQKTACFKSVLYFSRVKCASKLLYVAYITGSIHSWFGCKEWSEPEADATKPSWQDLDHGGRRRSFSCLQVFVCVVYIALVYWPHLGFYCLFFCSDTICDLGGVDELANYGEYSGAPSEQQTYDYAKTILSLMTRERHPEGESWVK